MSNNKDHSEIFGNKGKEYRNDLNEKAADGLGYHGPGRSAVIELDTRLEMIRDEIKELIEEMKEISASPTVKIGELSNLYDVAKELISRLEEEERKRDVLLERAGSAEEKHLVLKSYVRQGVDDISLHNDIINNSHLAIAVEEEKIKQNIGSKNESKTNISNYQKLIESSEKFKERFLMDRETTHKIYENYSGFEKQ